ncbi:MAG: type II toxin-antitoxin system VapC family toxin [Acidithiobacillales bacterium]
MSAVYLETSAVLRWLFAEPGAPAIARAIQESPEPVCSVLTILEAQRALVRAGRERRSWGRRLRLLPRRLGEASADWNLLEITPAIRIRAAEPFPVEPVRTLDAIHLATALQVATAFPGLSVLTFDERILSNLEPLGLLRAAIEA